MFYKGPDRASFPEAKLSSGDVREETYQSKETGSQTDQTSPASCSETRSEISAVFSQYAYYPKHHIKRANFFRWYFTFFSPLMFRSTEEREKVLCRSRSLQKGVATHPFAQQYSSFWLSTFFVFYKYIKYWIRTWLCWSPGGFPYP